jgi:hypothetical protein
MSVLILYKYLVKLTSKKTGNLASLRNNKNGRSVIRVYDLPIHQI